MYSPDSFVKFLRDHGGKPRHLDHPVPRWRAYHTRVYPHVSRDRHLYAYKTRRSSKAHWRRSRICQPRESPERLRNFAVISRRVFARLTNRRPARGGRQQGYVSKLSSSLERSGPRSGYLPGFLPLLRHDLLLARPWHLRSILTRESHYFSRPFFLSRAS